MQDYPYAGMRLFQEPIIFRLLSHSYYHLIRIKEGSVWNYASVLYEKAFFIFGGMSNSKILREIGRLDAVTRTWSLAGSLNKPRDGHAVVFDGFQFLVIGGDGDFKTENCVPNETTVNCTEQQLGLDNYEAYFEIMLVDANYGNDC